MATMERAHRAGKKYLNPVSTAVGGAGMIPKVFWKYLTTRAERMPRTPLGPFQTSPSAYATPPTTGLRVTWMGHSSILLEVDGARILIDPMWDERAGPVSWAGPKRFFAAPLAIEELPELDAILISHDHYDHLGAETVVRLARAPAAAGARWITSLGVGAILQRLGLKRFGVGQERVTELDWMESVRVGALEVTALPARHFSGRSLFNRFETLWSSFAFVGLNHRVYYGADSGEWPGFAEIGRRYGPFDLAMLEIGAYDPLWADIHMGPDGAARSFAALRGATSSAELSQAASTGLLMPIHWGLFDLALHAWRQPIERLSSLEGLALFAPEPGLPTDVVPGVEVRSGWWR